MSETEIIVATCSYPGTYDIKESLHRHHAYIDQAADGDASLVLFPEISLHGYPPLFELTGPRAAGSMNPTAAEIMAAAESVPDGPLVTEIAEHAQDRRIHVTYGLNEAGDQPGVVYNTCVLTGPSGHIGAYRKVHVHALESVLWRRGHDFPIFRTELGRIGVMICYDKWWPESARELTLRGAEVILAPAAWTRSGESANNEDVLEHTYCLYDEVRALENSRWVISSNFVGSLGGIPYGGLSRVVDPMGKLVVTTGAAEGLAFATIDVSAGIRNAAASMRGARLIRDRRPDAYRALSGAEPIAIDG